MPLVLDTVIFDDSMLGIWSIEEDESFFYDHLELSEEEKTLFEDYKGKNRLEWLSSRHLIHLMSQRDQRAEILKDKFGKPFIQDSDHHISFSHSHGMSAAVASKSRVGVDIQLIVPKITRIRHKYVNVNEDVFIDEAESTFELEMFHVIWGIKESMYKAYGIRGLDFKKNMDVRNISKTTNDLYKGNSTLIKDDYQMNFQFEAFKLDQHVLVYAIEVI